MRFVLPPRSPDPPAPTVDQPNLYCETLQRSSGDVQFRCYAKARCRTVTCKLGFGPLSRPNSPEVLSRYRRGYIKFRWHRSHRHHAAEWPTKMSSKSNRSGSDYEVSKTDDGDDNEDEEKEDDNEVRMCMFRSDDRQSMQRLAVSD